MGQVIPEPDGDRSRHRPGGTSLRHPEFSVPSYAPQQAQQRNPTTRTTEKGKRGPANIIVVNRQK